MSEVRRGGEVRAPFLSGGQLLKKVTMGSEPAWQGSPEAEFME